jgi:hypothetical protein
MIDWTANWRTWPASVADFRAPESREVLEALDIREFSAHLWLGGYLLYPWPGKAAPPGCASAAFAWSLAAPKGLGRIRGPESLAAGNPCPAMHGWRLRTTRPSRHGAPSSWTRG